MFTQRGTGMLLSMAGGECHCCMAHRVWALTMWGTQDLRI